MKTEGLNRRTMIIGILMSAVVAFLFIRFSDNPLIAIASGMIVGVIFQRIIRTAN